MAIKAEITKQPKSSVKLDISIDTEDVTSAFNETYTELSKKIKVKGFRPGKVPVSVIKMKYGNAVTSEVLDKLLNNAFRQAIQDNNLHPVSRGDINGELPELKEGESFAFAMTVDIYPEFEIGEYGEIPVTRDSYEIKDKDLEGEITHLAERFATVEDIEEGKVEKDSMVIIDYDVEFKGEIQENLSRKGQSYDQSQGSGYPNLKKGLVGLSVGDSADIKSSFPKEFPDEEKAGKDVVFKVKVIKMQKRVLPEINDEFVSKISGDKTVDEFRTNLRKNMEEHAKSRESRNVQSDIIDHLNKNTEIDLPDSMVQSEINSLIANLKNQLLYSRSTFEQYLEESGKTEEEVREEFTEPAEKQVKTMLILNEIGKKENIKAEENEISEEVEQLARRYSATFEETYRQLAEHGEIDSIAFGIRRRKTLEMLESKAKIKKGKTLGYTELKNS